MSLLPCMRVLGRAGAGLTRGWPLLVLLPLAAGLLSLLLGRYPISPGDIGRLVAEALSGSAHPGSEALRTVLFSIRLPRIAAALLIGGELSVSGAAYQGLFKNPMVSPDILGASAGAGFGAALAILLSLNLLMIQLCSFLCGLGAVLLTTLMGGLVAKRDDSMLALVLTGMIVGTFFSAGVSMAKVVADPENKLPAITFWLMGGLGTIKGQDVATLLVPAALGLGPLLLLRWRLNAFAFGEEEARAMGVDTGLIRAVVILCATLLTASAVSVAGMVGWVGLVIPHLARMLVGPNYERLLPAAFCMGCVFLLLVDDAARCLFPMEIPLGILTAVLGAPFFFYLLARRGKGWA